MDRFASWREGVCDGRASRRDAVTGRSRKTQAPPSPAPDAETSRISLGITRREGRRTRPPGGAGAQRRARARRSHRSAAMRSVAMGFADARALADMASSARPSRRRGRCCRRRWTGSRPRALRRRRRWRGRTRGRCAGFNRNVEKFRRKHHGVGCFGITLKERVERARCDFTASGKRRRTGEITSAIEKRRRYGSVE